MQELFTFRRIDVLIKIGGNNHLAIYGIYRSREDLVELTVHEATKADIRYIESWVHYAKDLRLDHLDSVERCNWLMWDYVLGHIGNFDGKVYKIVSMVTNKIRLEGMLHISINNQVETVIEALEVAPWNRECYLGSEREFRQLGLVLFGQAIMHGYSLGALGSVRLQSLDHRIPYYKGLFMNEVQDGEFTYTKSQSDDLIDHLLEVGLID